MVQDPASAKTRFEDFGRKIDERFADRSPRIEEEVKKVITYLNDEVVPQVRQNSSQALARGGRASCPARRAPRQEALNEASRDAEDGSESQSSSRCLRRGLALDSTSCFWLRASPPANDQRCRFGAESCCSSGSSPRLSQRTKAPAQQSSNSGEYSAI